MTDRRPLEGKRILVLEDDFYLATDQKQLLERAGAQVIGPFGQGCDESDIDAGGRIDGAVVDINLGQGPRFGLARRLEQRAIPFLFVTGYNADVIPEDLSRVTRLEKPVSERDLISALIKLVSASG